MAFLKTDLVQEMIALVQEEISHFKMVLNLGAGFNPRERAKMSM